ncbi:MAG: hypothetical protein Q9191_005416 [Dirinaria sp. TL-2023a]
MDSSVPRKDNGGALAMQMSPPHNPSAITHQTSSLPSTPYQRARKLSFHARSPSPEKSLGSRSPTAQSESDSGPRFRAKEPSLMGCKYETGMAFSRRRIPYSIGGDQLPRAKTMPKKYLNPAEEGKLSGDMRELYDRLDPSPDSNERRSKFITVDICITTPMKALERVCLLAKALAEHGMERVVCVPHAKVPIVKFWDPELQLACDMNVNNTLALENTRMIKTYVEIDPRVRPLAMIIKHWTRRRILNDAALGGTLSSYTWICMILSFLQTRNPPVLPCLHKRPHQRLIGADGKPSAFADDIFSLRGFGNKNKESLGELLFHFFRRYAHELDYERNVISIREGTLISKEDKKWHLMQNNRLCVEEPFNTDRNLGNTADDISFRGVHLELRRAFDLVADAKLDECMEQYVFPAVEEKIWEKPPPKPPPVLTRSQSQSGRGGRGGFSNRGGRHVQNQHRGSNQQGRRASSAAASTKFVNPQMVPGAVGLWEQPLSGAIDQFQLHEKLINDYQILQAQEHELRRVQAQAQMQAHLQAQGLSQVTSSAQQAARDHLAVSATASVPPLTAPLRPTHTSYPLPYSPAPRTTQQTVRTNPPSPSMKSTQPELRRSLNRSVNADNASTAGLRSHSQPARPLPMALPVPNPHALLLGGYSLQQYQQLRQQQLHNILEAQKRLRHPDFSGQGLLQLDTRLDENLPKEYIGYYVHDSPTGRAYQNEFGANRVPVYGEAPYRARGIPHAPNRLGDPSRSPSPSPSVPHRDRSTSIRSAASAPPGPIQIERASAPPSNLRTSGPIIVDGSDGWNPYEHPARNDTPLERTTTNDAYFGLRMQSHSHHSTIDEEPQQRSGRSETVSSMPSRQHDPFSTINGVHGSLDHASSPNANLKPRRVYPQVNGTAPAPVTAQLDSPISNGYKMIAENDRNTGNGPFPSSYRDKPLQNEAESPSASRDASKPEPSNASYDKPLKPVPLLSPVREVRTPSPTAMRKDDNGAELRPGNRLARKYQLQAIPPFSGKASAGQKDNIAGPLSPKPNGIPAVSAVNAQTGQSSGNGWQQTSSKKNKKHKSKNSGSQLTGVAPGEPMPVNEADRKGG